MKDIDISNLAESVMMQERITTPTPTAVEYSAPGTVGLPDAFGDQIDISNIQVPDTFMEKVLGESVEEPIEESVVEREETQDGADLLVMLYEEVQELKNMIKEMKTLLTEQTTVGAIGVNMGGAAADPFKKEQQRKKKPITLKAALKSRMR